MKSLLLAAVLIALPVDANAQIRIQLIGDFTSSQGQNFFTSPVSVPATATPNVPFNITWTATGAEVCQFLGSANVTPQSVTGWPVGQMCLNSTCDGARSYSVTIKTPGTYSLGLICTNHTGYATATVTAH